MVRPFIDPLGTASPRQANRTASSEGSSPFAGFNFSGSGGNVFEGVSDVVGGGIDAFAGLLNPGGQRNQGNARAAVFQKISELQNQGVAPNQILQQVLSAPEFQDVFLGGDITTMQKSVAGFIQAIQAPQAPKPKIETKTLSEGQSLFQIVTDPTTGQQTTRQVASVPKPPAIRTAANGQFVRDVTDADGNVSQQIIPGFNPAKPQEASFILTQNDPLAIELGIDVQPGEQIIAGVIEGVNGKKVVTSLKVVGADGTTIDIGEKPAAREAIKIISKLGDQRGAAERSLQLADRIIQLTEGVESPQGIVGAISRVGASTIAIARQLATASGIEFSPANFATELAALEKFGINDARVKANVLALAFATAKADESGRLSDQDIKLRLQQIGAGAGSRRVLLSNLNELKLDVVGAYNNNQRIKGGLISPDFKAMRPPGPLDDAALRGLGITPPTTSTVLDVPVTVPAQIRALTVQSVGGMSKEQLLTLLRNAAQGDNLRAILGELSPEVQTAIGQKVK